MHRAADLLKEVLARAGVDPQAPQALIYRLWDELLGADLAGSAWLRDIRRGRLEVEVDHPARLQLVRMRQREILRRVRRRFPELAVTGLHVVVGSRQPRERERGGAAGGLPGAVPRERQDAAGPRQDPRRIDRSGPEPVYSQD